MNGVHDMGGQHCHGAIPGIDDQCLFHEPWEREVLALALAMGATGTWNLDESRSTRESLPPAFYLDAGYYAIWLTALEKLLVRHALITTQELEEGRAIEPAANVKRVLQANDVKPALAAGAPVNRKPDKAAQFKVGDKVKVRQLHRRTHTRLPGYVRGHSGIVERIHGCHIFPDAHAIGQGEQPQWLYNIGFIAKELWGDDSKRPGKVYVDCWEPYLEDVKTMKDFNCSPHRSATATPDTQHTRTSCNDLLETISTIPREDNEPVFREPWQAEVFAIVLSLHEQSLFSWSEWAEILSQQITQAQQQGDADKGDTYYNHWLSALEKLLVLKGIGSEEQLASLYNRWDKAAQTTPHGQAIELS